MQSLRDKLLKAGLVSEDQAKKAESEIVIKRAPPPARAEVERQSRGPRPEGRGGERRGPPEVRGGERRGPPEGRGGERRGPPDRRGPPSSRPPRAPDANIPKLPPMPGSRAFQQAESRKQLELTKRVRDLVVGAQVETDVGATVFYFMTRKKLLRRLELTQTQAAELEAGRLAVVERPDPDRIEHALVPAAAADELLGFFPKAVRFYNRAESPIGFMSDDELKTRQDAEASGEAAAAAEAEAESESAAAESESAATTESETPSDARPAEGGAEDATSGAEGATGTSQDEATGTSQDGSAGT